jgi:hypothetical protein
VPPAVANHPLVTNLPLAPAIREVRNEKRRN